MSAGNDRLLLRFGFFAALLMSFVCLTFCIVYLILYQQDANAVVANAIDALKTPQLSDTQQAALQLTSEAHMFTSKVMLQSCGIVAGIAFGFLGFCLFLMGIEGQIDATVEQPAGTKINVTRLAPGAFILMLATILIGLCSTARIPVKLDTHSTPRAEKGHARPPVADRTPPDIDTSEPGAASNGQGNAS